MVQFNLRLVGVLVALPLVLAVSGCTPAVTQTAQHDETTARLLGAMEECLLRQSEVATTLATQSGQLQALQSRLEAAGTDRQKPRTTRAPERCAAMARDSGKIVVGRMERIWFPNLNLLLAARVDTGAETSSIDARNVERFERNGKPWVRFEIAKPDSGDAISVEREVSRVVSIVQSSQPEGERRPVIALEIAIGNVKQTAEFTLSDRSHLNHQAMIGRNVLQDVMVVDVSRKNAAPPVTGDRPAPAGKATR